MDTLALRRIDRAFWPAALIAAKIGSWCLRYRRQDPRALILRPGGMGDLIVLCIAVEQLGFDPRDFFWVIEKRSSVWARHLGLDYACYDDGLVKQNWKLAGRFATIVNSEQFFGLSQATAAIACGRRSTLVCFASNRAAAWAGRRVVYDPDRSHEAREFQRLLVAAMDVVPNIPDEPERSRRFVAVEKPVVGLGGLQSESRAFSEEEWARFIESWAGASSFWIASSETDRPLARRLAARFSDRAELFEGSFDALCDRIARSEEVFTVDGGFLHIASYYGVPVTGVFTSGRDGKWAALAPGSRMVRRSDLACQPCTWFGQVPACTHQFACKELDFEKHVRAARPLHPAPIDGLLPVVRSGPGADAVPVGAAVHADRTLRVLPDDVSEPARR
jgi:glycosyl transferase family 9 (putative heptosyltransferase)